MAGDTHMVINVLPARPFKQDCRMAGSSSVPGRQMQLLWHDRKPLQQPQVCKRAISEPISHW